MFNSIYWHKTQDKPGMPIDSRYKSWLLDKGSLTARLSAMSHGHFSVKLLNQAWQRPLPDESLSLHIKDRQVALVREVLLLCYDTPVVYARTIIPRHTTTGKLRQLKHLKEKSLGAALFKYPGLERSGFEIAKIRPMQQSSTIKPLAKGEYIYGRRSLFSLYGKQILVAEVFLPACLAHTNQ